MTIWKVFEKYPKQVRGLKPTVGEKGNKFEWGMDKTSNLLIGGIIISFSYWSWYEKAK